MNHPHKWLDTFNSTSIFKALASTMLCSMIAFTAYADDHLPVLTVDTHAHVFKKDLKLEAVRRYAPKYDATIDDYLRQLDANRMSRGVLVQPSFLGTDNSFMLESMRNNPSRLRGVAVVKPDISVKELNELAAANVVGVRLNLVGKPIPDFTAAPWPQFLARVKKLDWHVEIHREAADLPKIVAPLLKSGVNIVVDHFGRYDAKLGVEDPGFKYLLSTAKTKRVWVKISAWYRNEKGVEGGETAKSAVKMLLDAFGPERILWGSDWPHTNFEKSISYEKTRLVLDELVPDAKTRQTILVETPAHLFKFN